jgi:hypothetical protein
MFGGWCGALVVGFEEVEAMKEELDTGEEPAAGMVCVSVCGVTHIRTHTRARCVDIGLGVPRRRLRQGSV